MATQHTELPNGLKTGAWAEEVAAPYYVFKDAGFDVFIASPSGGKVPLDPKSLQPDNKTQTVEKFLSDEEATKALNDSLPISSIREYDVSAIFLAGGHGAVFDFPENKTLADLLTESNKHGKVISAVCHGPAGLINAKGEDNKPLVYGKEVTGFSNSEEKSVGMADKVPFLLEDKLIEEGGKYRKGPDWTGFVVTDGKLVTGQNPQSSKGTAEGVVTVLG